MHAHVWGEWGQRGGHPEPAAPVLLGEQEPALQSADLDMKKLDFPSTRLCRACASVENNTKREQEGPWLEEVGLNASCAPC